MASPSKVSTQLEPWCDLEDKVVLITGASSGLGWDFCITLAKAGCKVIAAARRADRLKSLCDQINQSSTTPRAVALALDVTADAPAIEAAVEKAWALFNSQLRHPRSVLDLFKKPRVFHLLEFLYCYNERHCCTTHRVGASCLPDLSPKHELCDHH